MTAALTRYDPVVLSILEASSRPGVRTWLCHSLEQRVLYDNSGGGNLGQVVRCSKCERSPAWCCPLHLRSLIWHWEDTKRSADYKASSEKGELTAGVMVSKDTIIEPSAESRHRNKRAARESWEPIPPPDSNTPVTLCTSVTDPSSAYISLRSCPHLTMSSGFLPQTPQTFSVFKKCWNPVKRTEKADAALTSSHDHIDRTTKGPALTTSWTEVLWGSKEATW